MVITILEGEVDEGKWKELQESFRRLDTKESIIPFNSYLVQDNGKSTVWKLISIWKDMETLQNVRDSGETPKGVILFQEVGVNPTLSIFDVRETF